MTALRELGTPVDCAGVRTLPLDGRFVLWLVTDGVMDLFAVDAAQSGRWHFVGRLEPGALVASPLWLSSRTLVGRPLQGCAVRRVQLNELIRTQRDVWAKNREADELSSQERAVVHGVDMCLRATAASTVDGLPPRDFVSLEPGEAALSAGQHGRPLSVVWLTVPPESRVRFGSGSADGTVAVTEQDWVSCDADLTLLIRTTGDLLREDTLWQHLVTHHSRFLGNVDRWIARSDQAHRERTIAGRLAGDDARQRADQALLAVLETQASAEVDTRQDDAVLAACRLVADASGITLVDPDSVEPGSVEPDRVEAIATASGFRTRKVRLDGRWWRGDVGPLLAWKDDGAPVALLWRRGAYDAVDPVTGQRERVSTVDIDSAVMFYEPLPETPVGVRDVLRFGVRDNSRDLRDTVIGAVAAVAFGLAVPLGTGQILGVLVPRAERGLIVQLAVALLIAAAVAGAFMFLQNTAVLRVEGRVDARVQAAVWDRLLRLPVKFFTGRSTGELASAAMGISAIRQVMAGVSAMVMYALIVGVVNVGLMFSLHVPLTLAALLLIAAGTAAFVGLGLRRLRWQRQLTALTYQLSNRAFHTLRGLPKLRTAAAESFAYAHWARDYARSRQLDMRIGRLSGIDTMLKESFLPWCTLVMFVLLAGPARGVLSVSDFLTFSVALSMVLMAVVQFTGVFNSVADAVPLYDQLKPVLRAVPEVHAASVSPGELSGEIEANQMSFRYTEDGPLVLQDVSFRVLPGEFVAIVGGSGSGKSTLLRLLIGFDSPTAGTVLYDGQDLSRLDRAAVRRQCGVVLQNAQPFSGTILDSVRGTTGASLDEVWEAVAMAGLEGDIRQLPMGIHTVVGDEGGTLSGGQAQRLMIANALLRRPRILFFDEATSALDNETQGVVTASTRSLHATRVIIAHRLSTVMDADRVIVLSDGRITQAGAPSALLADRDGLFHHLVRRQLQ